MNVPSHSIKFLIATTVLLLASPPIRSEEQPSFTLEEAAIENLQLQFSTAEIKAVTRQVLAAGTVKLNEKRVIEVTPRIDGTIMTDPLSLGATVKEGDVLCQLQSSTLSELVSSYLAAEDAMTFAVAVADQERKLAEKNLSSAEQVRQKELELTQAIAEHERALQPLKILDFTESSIHLFLNNKREPDYTIIDIKAPAGGEIIEKDLRQGAAIKADHSLFVIADLSELWVDFHIALRDAESLAEGSEVEVESTVSDKNRRAEILYVSPLADERSRTVLVRALLKNDDHEWRPGTPVSVTAASNDPTAATAALAVPVSAIVDFDNGRAVFVKSDDGSFSPTSVETGASDGTLIEILGGLEEGQTIVSLNAPQLKGHLEMTASE
jgi:cobalt-zinc-cadmium efflux system membrane fusion protein